MDARGSDRAALGRRAETTPPIARLLRGRRASTALPEHRPGAILLNRLWPLMVFTLIAGGLAFLRPQIPGIAAGFAIIWALAWRRQHAAVAAIEERDGVCFYVCRTSPVRPIALQRTPGFKAMPSRAAPAAPSADGWIGARCPVDVLIVSLGSTAGLRTADTELADSLRRAGALGRCAVAAPPRSVRTLALTDLTWALAARRAASAGAAEHRPRAVIYSSTTTSLLWPRPGAIRFDAPSAGNRPGRHGLWQRPLERRRLARAPLLLPWSAAVWPRLLPRRTSSIVRLSCPSRSSPPVLPLRFATSRRSPTRANPAKKGLDRVLAAWTRVRRR